MASNGQIAPLSAAALAAMQARVDALACLPPPPWITGGPADPRVPSGWVSPVEVAAACDDYEHGRYPTLAIAWDRGAVAQSHALMTFFAHAREDIPALLAEVARLRNGEEEPDAHHPVL